MLIAILFPVLLLFKRSNQPAPYCIHTGVFVKMGIVSLLDKLLFVS